SLDLKQPVRTAADNLHDAPTRGAVVCFLSEPALGAGQEIVDAHCLYVSGCEAAIVRGLRNVESFEVSTDPIELDFGVRFVMWTEQFDVIDRQRVSEIHVNRHAGPRRIPGPPARRGIAIERETDIPGIRRGG